MHMTSAPHLLTEDRPEFDRLLDEALRTARERPEFAALGERLNAEQLRTMALGASALLTAAAADEYDHYVRVREERRDEVLSRPGTAGEEAQGQDGAGLGAMIAVLAPVLAGAAMLIFLLVGYLLKLIEPEPAFADTMLMAGSFFGVLTVASLVCAGVGLLVTAVRNGATEVTADGAEAVPDEVARARDAWRTALLERGIMPFLRDALADPGAGGGLPAPRRRSTRMPHLGYTAPDFTSPGSPSESPRPGYTAPDFSGPAFGGQEREPQ